MTEDNQVKTKVRLDKWLWAARFYKTRSIAKGMINGGKVHYNGQRTRSSKIVEIGATIILRQGFDQKELTILSLTEQRLNATKAQLLYKESAESVAKRQLQSEQRRLNILNNPAPERKPDKKQRRQLLKIKEF